MRPYTALGLLLSAALPTLAPGARAQTPVTVVKVWATDTQRYSHFGRSVRFLGDLMIVGAEQQIIPEVPGFVFTGSVYAFRQTGQGPYGGYVEEAALRPQVGNGPNGSSSPASYGQSIGVCAVPGGDTFVIGGAPGETIPNPNRPVVPFYSAGAAYVHRRDAATGTWTLDRRLAGPSPRTDGQDGINVAIACEPAATPGGTPIVDAFVTMSVSDGTRRLLVWHRDAAGAWSIGQTLSDGFPVVATAPGPGSTHAAVIRSARFQRVEVLRRLGPESAPYAVEATLSSPLTGPYDYYGSRLDIDRDLIVVGSENNLPNGVPGVGRAHVYRYTGSGPFGGWAEEAVLTPSVPRRYFAESVAVWAGPAGDGVGGRVVVQSGDVLTVYGRDAAGVWREDAVLDPAPTYPWGGRLSAVDGRFVAAAAYTSTTERGTESGVVNLLDLRSVVAGEGPVASATRVLAVSGANPTRGRSEVTVTLDAAAPVAVALFDALGRRVAVLHEGALGAGPTRLGVDASGLPPGVYVVRAEGPFGAASARLAVVR